MQSDSGSQQIFEMKRRVSELVRAKFARYGDNVLAIILGYALQPANMPRLMDRLGIQANTRSLEASLDTLAGFIATHGAQEFTRKAMNLRVKEEVQPIDVEKFEAQASQAPVAPVAAPASIPDPAQANLATGDAPAINVPGYTGPDRRKGERRRQSRREDLAATSRNKRFGGDRRKEPKGRRAEDRIRPDRWWRFLGDKDEAVLLPFLNRKG